MNDEQKSILSKSIEFHELWSKPQQPIQSVWQEFPCKQIAHIRALPIVLTFGSTSQLLQELNGHVRSHELRWMRPTPRPVNPSQRPVRIFLPKLDANICGQVVLIRVAWGSAILCKHWKILSIWNHLHRNLTVHLEPLWSLPPLLESDLRAHFRPVSVSADWSGFVVCLHKCLGWCHEIIVDDVELKEWYTRLWEEHKTLVWEVK